MQRTRITAKLLVGLAVTTVSGCVSVEPGPAPPPYPEVAAPVQDVAPQIVQPPAREALEVVPDPSRPTARPPSPAPPAAASRRTGPAGTAPPRKRADPPLARTPHRPPGVPSVTVPALPRVPGGGTDVCALGRGYGGWPAGSPEARICSETYGR
ncbi:hypothetical protein PV749_22670 [Streptomyces sp. ID03-2B]|uniref:hypothetical protein n=1 Tax=Streptomyces sp. ID03-2B TaxID=3028660 RepID=UPI0029A39B51|nr:hypothetical protein [Streptomyces sp. ID03-2B]MDX3593926.1 hypothetical protein [Streptomyces sp. ID03-2B]